jgi:hypothetical protein
MVRRTTSMLPFDVVAASAPDAALSIGAGERVAR